MSLLLPPTATLAASGDVRLVGDGSDAAATDATTSGQVRSGDVALDDGPGSDLPAGWTWLSTPLGIWMITSLGGVCLFLLVVRWPLRDDDIPPGPFRMALVPAAAPTARRRGPWRRLRRRPPVTRDDHATEAIPELPPSAPRAFDGPPARGVERFTIGYQRVRLSAAADDLRSTEVGRLERGDEVELLGSFEGYIQVRTPSGATGWIHRNTIV
jgi:hypothetical protein